jgi:TatD DNase family protein
LIDCHAHLADHSFANDLGLVLENALQAGVETVIAVSEDADDGTRVLDIAARQPMVRPCLGLHPEHADLKKLAAVERLIRKHANVLVGIGEVGLDYWLAKTESARTLQREVLSRFVALSRELDLVLNVHSRSAGHYAIDLLVAQGARRVLMHGFDGRAAHALRAAAQGYLFSIPPSVVRSPQKQKLVSRLPLEALVLETDAPVLGPTKGERNVPQNAVVSAARIAEIKGVALAEVAALTTTNARRLFALD